jgi:hypothetical protein
MDLIINRLRKEIDRYYGQQGMSTWSGQIKVQVSDIQGLCDDYCRIRGDYNELLRSVTDIMESVSAAIDKEKQAPFSNAEEFGEQCAAIDALTPVLRSLSEAIEMFQPVAAPSD